MTIIDQIKSGRLVAVPREARNAAAPENAGDAEALRVALELMNMRQNNGTKRDDLLYEAAAFLKRRGYLVPASPDHTTALVALVEGMERERDEARRQVGGLARLLDDQLGTPCEQIRHQQTTEALAVAEAESNAWRVAAAQAEAEVIALKAAEARALAAEAKVEALREALVDAAEAIEHWGAYASSYLQEKHDWAGDIARARALTGDTP